MKFLKFILILAAVVGSSMFLFYWFQVRPADIRKLCLEDLKNRAKAGENLTGGNANNYFRICTVKNGLEAEDIVNK